MSDNQERIQYMQDNRLDNHEIKIEQIFATLDRMETVMERQAEAMRELSDSMIKLAASQEMMTTLTMETRANSERIHAEEKNAALMEQRINSAEHKISHIEEDIKRMGETQTTQKVKLAGILAVAAIVGGAVSSIIIPMMF